MTPTHARLPWLGMALAAACAAAPARAQVFTDTVIVQDSACIGVDCASGENFGFDTLRLKGNNLRLHFADTSATGSFPTRDWRLILNDTDNGGPSFFAIEDADAGRIPFRIEGDAPADALYVDATGHVGIGQAHPMLDLHILSGNTPALRFEQDGASGFRPQTWDMGGNEAGFFIRDTSHGGALALRIQPDAGDDAMVIEGGTGHVGYGTATPEAPLHVRADVPNNLPHLLLESIQPTGRAEIWMRDGNAGADNDTMRLQLNDDDFNISFNGTGGTELRISKNGDVTVLRGDLMVKKGDVIVGGTRLNVPDYVFAEGYELMPLDDLAAFIARNRHLPGIPSAGDVAATGLGMAQMQMALLRTVEEQTLYILELRAELAALRARIAQD
ncbi:hypothetical protein [Pseudoruegeria sp. HB172150]|uniref:hypothetical protein n=1 Tax=Pseudoruegeria sp. HB172150 TaxID=2721164 RepID=UPI001557D925|nr:hypothetical protein [Pseudoruegeria sp. HB172150]